MTDTGSIREAEAPLFREWSQGRDRFASDGVVDENVYVASTPRILFVLKETNDFAQDLRSFLREGGIAVLNVKKTAGRATSNATVIDAAARADEDLIRRQVDIYQPNIIVAASGEGWHVPQVGKDGWVRTTRGTWYRPFDAEFGSGVAIGMWHPQVRFPHRLLFFTLVDAALELRDEGLIR